MRKIKLNKELAKEADVKLTHRAAKSVRDKLFKQASFASNLTEAHIAGINTCQECQTEYDFHLTKEDQDLIKFIYTQTMPAMRDADFKDATDETKSKEEQYQSFANLLTNSSLLEGAVKHHYQDAVKCRDKLIELTNKIEPLKKRVREKQ